MRANNPASAIAASLERKRRCAKTRGNFSPIWFGLLARASSMSARGRAGYIHDGVSIRGQTPGAPGH